MTAPTPVTAPAPAGRRVPAVSRFPTSAPRSAAEVAAVVALVRAAEEAVGQDLVTDHHAAHQADPDADAAGGPRRVIGHAAWDPDGARPLAYAQAARGPRRWELELAYDHDPGVATASLDAAAAALGATIDEVGRAGGGPINLWITRAEPAHDRLADAVGLRPARDLWQVRRPLPADEPWSLATRPFVVGQDEGSWLAVNNRAFDWHPEQGGWSLDDVRAREAEPWFDAAGFLVHEVDGQMAGFCWTKVHADHDPPLGEIYVIAVDPARHQRGLGRALVLAGLDHLSRAGLTVAMLYVDADNTPATRLYDRLGFRLHHVDRAYTTDVPPT